MRAEEEVISVLCEKFVAELRALIEENIEAESAKRDLRGRMQQAKALCEETFSNSTDEVAVKLAQRLLEILG